MPVMEPHGLGQCWCGQYHLTATWVPGTVTSVPLPTAAAGSYTISTWPLAEQHELGDWVDKLSYEGKHRSE